MSDKEENKVSDKPWLVPMSIPHIERLLKPSFVAIEFGAGGSTVWLKKRVQSVFSVEHDEAWASQAFKAATEIKTGNILMIKQPRPYDGVCDMFDDHYFDFALIDGRDRVACMKSVFPKLKSGAFLVIDNSERIEYQEGIEWLKKNGCKVIKEFVSEEPQPYFGWTTTIYQKS